MQMKDSEIIRRYKQSDKKREQIKILAELNACTKEDIRQILRDAGLDVPATGNRYTAAKKGAEVTEEDGSKRKQAKLTEKGKRLLKNEEPAESSDLSAPDDVGTCQQNVGTMSETMAELGEAFMRGFKDGLKEAEEKEDPGKRMFGDSLEAKKAAPTACQPAEPVDVWSDIFDEQMDKQAEETRKAAQKKITLGDILQLMDPERELDDRLAIMDENGGISIAGLTKSPYWDSMTDYVVTSIAATGDCDPTMKVWLKEKEGKA